MQCYIRMSFKLRLSAKVDHFARITSLIVIWIWYVYRLLHVSYNIIIFLHVNLVFRRVKWTILIHNFPHEASNLIKVTHVFICFHGFRTVNDLWRVRTSFVLLKMPVKIGLLTKTPLTKGTFERFLFVVNISNVSLEIRWNWKRSLAVFAFIRLFSGVCPQMSCQVGWPGEHLPAELAAVPVLGLVPPCQHVRVAAQPAQEGQRGGEEGGGGHRVHEGWRER